MTTEIKCVDVAAQLKAHAEVYLLLVSEDCPFCAEVLEAIEKAPLDLETLIVNTDACESQLDSFVDWPAVPMIAHFRDGKEVRRGIGLDSIMSFGTPGGSAAGSGSADSETYYELATGDTKAGEEVDLALLATEDSEQLAEGRQ